MKTRNEEKYHIDWETCHDLDKSYPSYEGNCYCRGREK